MRQIAADTELLNTVSWRQKPRRSRSEEVRRGEGPTESKKREMVMVSLEGCENGSGRASTKHTNENRISGYFQVSRRPS